MINEQKSLERRAEVHAALGEPTRLAIVDSLATSDRAPGELAARLGLGTNLLSHHLDVLEAAGVVERRPSSGDGRRRYVTRRAGVLDVAGVLETAGCTPDELRASRVVFVCTANSARSLLAEALWHRVGAVPATSGGTAPASAPHEGAVGAARRAGLAIDDAVPAPIPPLDDGDLVVTVCDVAREHMTEPLSSLHWSIPDPATDGDFDGALARIEARVRALAPLVHATN